MESINVVKAYFRALDAADIQEVDSYLDDNYQLIDFTPQSMDKIAMLAMIAQLKVAMPNLTHSLSNIRVENDVVKVTVQRSGTHTANLDLSQMGLEIVPSTRKFIIFPNSNYEFTIKNQKILIERDVSPVSPSRRISGMLKALGIESAYHTVSRSDGRFMRG
jgi:hypothetical protein